MFVGWKSISILISRGIKNTISLQETYYFQILQSEFLLIAGYEDLKSSIFHQLAVKLWLKEDDDQHTNNPWYSSKFIHSKVQTFHKIVLFWAMILQATK